MTSIASLRLNNQHIGGSRFTTAQQIVAWMGAMQAQDFPMAKWALGIRLPDSTEIEIEAAFNKGELLRTHLLRPTWHLVTSNDVSWMLELTAPHIKASLKPRYAQLGLTPDLLSRCERVIEIALHERPSLTREEIVTELNKVGIATDENRASHILGFAELDQLLCSGPIVKGKPTFALLDARVLKKKTFTREEALGCLASTYFSSHGPATLQDFTWWSGLPVSEARRALEIVKSNFISETVNGLTFWSSGFEIFPAVAEPGAYLLPAYDELIISYADRQAMLPLGFQDRSISSNGVFKPVILIDGLATGVWKRTFTKDRVIVEIEFFDKRDEGTLSQLDAAVGHYGHFLGKIVDINP